jgi:hypothetical protein
MSKQTITFIFSSAATFLLAACSAAPSVDSPTPLPPGAVVDSSPTHQATAETHTSPSFDCQKIQELSVEECQALVALYERTNGNHWQENSGWLVDETPCQWYGVICQQGHVNQLYLAHNQLSGSIPATLGNLTSLNELDLSFNQLTGSIPTELANLRGLYRLNLSYNLLTGTVPVVLTEAPISDFRLWGNLLDGTVPAAQGTITTVEYRIVKFEFDSKLAESVWPEIGVPLPAVNGEFSWATRPEHIRITFASHGVPDPFQGGGMNISGEPQIFIYPTRSFKSMSEIAKAEIDALQRLLETRPASPENEIPVLPLINAAQVFHVQLEYLDFQNGGGVRFITHYSQEDVSRVTKDNIFYTFQGLTQDGSYYVAVYFPISTAGLPDKPVDEDWDAALARLAETRAHLDGLPSHEFEPDLEILDNVIQSLVVNTP